MVIGAIFALIVSWVNPQQFTKDFFKGMGEGYGSVMGIIITAGVFAAGLKATGLIDAFVEVLKSSNEIARWGGSFGPFIMAAITGSGDAATFAFNEAVTPHVLPSACRFRTSAPWLLSPARWAVPCLRSQAL